jgi:RNA 2',3'-cyclic 3'-phosphodiesterase
MKQQDIIRTFIAIEIPDEVKAKMREVQDTLRKSGADVGWARPEGVHLTLKFLGNVEAGLIEQLCDAVAGAVSGTGPFELSVGGIGVFPNERAPRVVWLGLGGGLDTLAALYEKIEAACEVLGFKREARPFRPHLTLGRVKSPKGRERLMRSIAELEKVEVGGFTAVAVSVMKSELKPSGAVYTELGRAQLRP